LKVLETHLTFVIFVFATTMTTILF